MLKFLKQFLLQTNGRFRHAFSSIHKEKVPWMLLLLLVLFFGCASSLRNQKRSGSSKSLIVTERCAVIYWPSPAKIRKAKRKGKEDFYTASDDVLFYLANSREFLEKHRIKIIETEAEQIEFYDVERRIEKMDLSSEDRMWGILLFNGTNRPIESDILDVEPDFREYMK